MVSNDSDEVFTTTQEDEKFIELEKPSPALAAIQRIMQKIFCCRN